MNLPHKWIFKISQALLIIIFSANYSNFAFACTPTIVFLADVTQPTPVPPSTQVVMQWQVQNVSACDAVGYSLGYYNATPSSATTDFGGNSHPTFTLLAGEVGVVSASFITPAEINFYKVDFDILDVGGTPLPALSGGRLFTEFATDPNAPPPINPCLDVNPPTIEEVIAHVHDGNLIVQAEVVDEECGLASVSIEVNGTLYTMLPDPSGANLFSVDAPAPYGDSLDYTIIAIDVVGNKSAWQAGRGYVNYSTVYHRLGLGYAGYNGHGHGPNRENSPCSASCGKGQGSGDPVNMVNGNLVDQTYLLNIPGRAPIDFHLTFNNQSARESIFGYNFTHTYNYHLVEMDNQYYKGAFIQYPDGHMVVYEDFQTEAGYYETLTKTSSGYELTFTSLHKVIFNEDGDIERYEDHNGNGLNFTYDETVKHTLRSQLISIEADGGRQIEFIHNGEGQVVSINASEGKTLRFNYELSAQDQGDLTPYLLTEFIDGNGGKTEYKYDDVNNLLEKISPNGHPYFVNEFDDQRRVIKQSIGSDFSYVFDYVEDPSDPSIVTQASTTDANGHVVGYEFTGGLMTSRTDQNGNVDSYTYTDNKEVETSTDKNGNITEYDYDGLGNTTAITDALNQVVSQTFDPTFSKPTLVINKQADHVTQLGYDGVGNLTSTEHALGDQQLLQYNNLGQLVERSDYNGNITRYTYTSEGDIETISHPDGGVELFSYDGLGRVSFYTDANNNNYLYSYDANDNLLSVLGPIGYNLSYVYDTNNHRISYTDANGGSTTYVYDDKENKVLERDQLGFERQSIFGPMNELIAEVDEEGVRAHHVYDPAYRRIQTIEAVNTTDQREINYAYDPRGNILSITDPEGRITTQTFDELHRRINMTRNTTGNTPDHENNITTLFSYSPTDMILQVLDANGNPMIYVYDPLDRLIRQSDAENQVTAYSYDAQSNRTRMTNPRGYTTTYGYDVMNRMASMTDALGGQFSFNYDLNSNHTQAEDANGMATGFNYDELNRRIATIRGFSGGGSSNDTNVTTKYVYDLHGNLTSMINPRGFKTSFDYDPAHRNVNITDALGFSTQFAYNKVDKVLSILNRRGHSMTYDYDKLYRNIEKSNEEGHADAYTFDRVDNTLTHVNKRGISHQYSYDPLDRLRIATDPYSNTKQYQYDAMGNVLSMTDENGHIDQYDYDLIYRKISETDAEGFTTQYGFDENSNLSERIDAENNATQYTFDELDRLVSVLNAENEEEKYEYDALTNITTRTEADGTDHDFSYDNLYRLVEVINNAKGGAANNDTNVTIIYNHDPSGNLVSQTDPNAHETAFAYDALDRLITEVNPIGSTWGYTYDPEGNAIARTDANGALTSYDYYPDHKLQSVSYPEYAVNFAYNETNFPLEMVDQLGQSIWQYDLLDRLIAQNDPLSQSLNYAYDPVGNLTSLRYPDNRSISHAYLKNDWLKQSNTNELNSITIDRNNIGAPEHYDRSNATTADIVYDRVYRALNIKDQQLDGTLITQFNYSYNPIGHITQEVAKYGWLQPSQVTTSFTYDGLHRLTRELNSDSLDKTFAYDPTGNRLSRTEKIQQGSTISNYVYDAANRMVEIDVTSNHNPTNALHTFDYDANGNRIDQLIQINGVDRGILYSYDTENRLTQHQNYLVTGGNSDNGSESGSCNAGNGQGNGNGCNNNGNDQEYNNTNGKGQKNGHANQNSGGGVGNSSGSATLNSVLLKSHTDLEYDGVGHRLISTYFPGASDGGKRTEFTFDRSDSVVEYSVWNQHTNNLYRDHQQNLLFKHALTAGNNVTSGNRFFFHHDGQGNISAVTKHQGQADKSYRFDAYGNILHPSGNAAVQRNGYSLSQKRFDAETELYYFGARHYDATTGTWLTQDIYRGELRNPQSLHRYMYNYDSPVNYVDWYGYYPDTYSLDRELQFLNFDDKSEPINTILSHTFIYTVDTNSKLMQTYSWGNQADEKGNFYWTKNREEDIDAAKRDIELRKEFESNDSIWKYWYLHKPQGELVGDDLSDEIEYLYSNKRRNKSDSSYHKNYWIWNNCKTEAKGLIREAKNYTQH